MKRSIIGIALSALFAVCDCAAQTKDEYEAETARLKAQEQYYNQMLATTKSQEAAAQAEIAAKTATLTGTNQLATAQLAADFAVANALKSSGLSAATGKEGSFTFASADKTPLAFRSNSLELTSALSSELCATVTRVGGKTFIAPANYEQMVQKSIPDVVLISNLNSAAVQGSQEIGGLNAITPQAVAATVGAALVTAQYLAGGVQAISKLFRTDYNLTYSTTDRSGLFAQQLTVKCPDKIEGNVEGRLRLGSTRILKEWIPNMTSFLEKYEALTELTTNAKISVTAKLAELKADTKLSADEKAKRLTLLEQALSALKKQEQVIAKYKASAASIKTFLSADKTSLHESLVWGQGYLATLGGTPAGIPAVTLDGLNRLTYQLAVEDAVLKSSSTFTSDKVRPLSTAELTYSLMDATGVPLSVGYWAKTTAKDTMKVKTLSFNDAHGISGKGKPAATNAGSNSQSGR